MAVLVLEGVAVVAVWVAVAAVLAGRSGALRRLADPGSIVALLIFVAWLRVLLSSFLRVVLSGREVTGAAAGPPRIAALISYVLLGVFLLLAARLIVERIRARAPAHLFAVLLFLLPWLVIEVAGYRGGHGPEVVTIFFPLTVLTVWLAGPDVRVLAVLGWLTATTAVLALVLGFCWPSVATYPPDVYGDKAILPLGLLAGPFSHANVLGLHLTLGIAFVLAIRRTAARRLGVACCLAALVWSGSRTSLVAALLVVLLASIIRTGRRWWGGRWVAEAVTFPPILVGAALTVLVPLLVRDPEAFTDRPMIWRAALADWSHKRWLGFGEGYFVDQPLVTNTIGGAYGHAHNVMVNLLVTGGLVAAGAIGLVFLLTWWRAARLASDGGPAEPLLFLVGLAHVAWLEASFANSSLLTFHAWLPMAVIVLASRTRPPTRPPAVPPNAGPPNAGPRKAVPHRAVPRTAVPRTAVPRTAVPRTAVPRTVVAPKAVPLKNLEPV